MAGRKQSVSATTKRKATMARAQESALITYTPNDLRDKVRQSLADLSETDQAIMCHRLLAGLRSGGVNISSSVMALGILARRTEELTPADMGKLLRYVRINWPKAIIALAGPLTELLASAKQAPMPAVARAGRAA